MTADNAQLGHHRMGKVEGTVQNLGGEQNRKNVVVAGSPVSRHVSFSPFDVGGPLAPPGSGRSLQPFLDVRTAVLNDTLEDAFRRRYPGFRPANDDQALPEAA